MITKKDIDELEKEEDIRELAHQCHLLLEENLRLHDVVECLPEYLRGEIGL